MINHFFIYYFWLCWSSTIFLNDLCLHFKTLNLITMSVTSTITSPHAAFISFVYFAINWALKRVGKFLQIWKCLHNSDVVWGVSYLCLSSVQISFLRAVALGVRNEENLLSRQVEEFVLSEVWIFCVLECLEVNNVLNNYNKQSFMF